MAPPQSYFFASWSGTRVMSQAQHATTVGHWAIHLGGWGRYNPPSSSIIESWWRSRKAPKNLHLTVPKSVSNIAQQYVDGYAFFQVYCSTRSQENPKGPKFSILKFPIRKNVLFDSSSWIIFLKFKRQAI